MGGLGDVRAVLGRAEDIDLVDGGGTDGGGDGPDLGLPPNFPVLPLGQNGGKFYFLTARGELAEHGAGALPQRSNLVALFAGADDPIDWLDQIGPKKARDVGFNAQLAADRLMLACSALPLFNTDMSIRHFGTWRGSDGRAVVHLGERIEVEGETKAGGTMLDGSLYPAVPSRARPADVAATADEIRFVATRVHNFWNWQTPEAANVVIGWIGQAALGHFPSWRTHCYIKGRHGSGKSTCLSVIADLLGGMCFGVDQASSAASIWQSGNRQAVARIFDEAENDADGRMEDVIALFRNMSGADGATVRRGTSDQAGIKFTLSGAGLMGSIIPGVMTPADRSRFVILSLDPLRRENPADAAAWLAELKDDASGLGPKIWRRMINLAPRWSKTFDFYSALVQRLGAEQRTGDTIGAILAGWDLMLFEDAVQADDARVALAKDIAGPLIEAAALADVMSDGERCLRAILAYQVQKDHGGHITISELLDRMQTHAEKPELYDQRLIGRLGLRLLGGDIGARDLFVSNAQNPLLDRALARTRWTGGGHRAALDTLDGVTAAAKPKQIIGGKVSRGVIVPASHLPGVEKEPAEE